MALTTEKRTLTNDQKIKLLRAALKRTKLWLPLPLSAEVQNVLDDTQ